MARPANKMPINAVRVSRLIDRKALRRIAGCGAAYAEGVFIEVRIGDTWFAPMDGTKLRTFPDYESANRRRERIEKSCGIAGATA